MKAEKAKLIKRIIGILIYPELYNPLFLLFCFVMLPVAIIMGIGYGIKQWMQAILNLTN